MQRLFRNADAPLRSGDSVIAGAILCIVMPVAAFIATWIFFGYYYDEYMDRKDRDEE